MELRCEAGSFAQPCSGASSPILRTDPGRQTLEPTPGGAGKDSKPNAPAMSTLSLQDTEQYPCGKRCPGICQQPNPTSSFFLESSPLKKSWLSCYRPNFHPITVPCHPAQPLTRGPACPQHQPETLSKNLCSIWSGGASTARWGGDREKSELVLGALWQSSPRGK